MGERCVVRSSLWALEKLRFYRDDLGYRGAGRQDMMWIFRGRLWMDLGWGVVEEIDGNFDHFY